MQSLSCAGTRDHHEGKAAGAASGGRCSADPVRLVPHATFASRRGSAIKLPERRTFQQPKYQ